MNIGFLGHSALAAESARRLMGDHRLLVHGEVMQDLVHGGAVEATSLEQLARSCDVIFIEARSASQSHELLFGVDGLSSGLSAGKIVVDQTVGDPEQVRATAAELQGRGVALVDAPVQCELVEELSDTSAILCGGPDEAVRAVRPLLEAICPKVVHFGEVGSGLTARLIVGAIAVCNRMITLECAAMGARNGLSVTDMATVLSRSSGASSATTRVLPTLGTGSRTTDQELGAVVEELRLASLLAMRLGAPALVAHLVHGLLRAEVNDLGSAASLDAASRRFHQATTATSGTLAA
jgi:3-hydroxyisobutyrate dehydrogenase